MRRILLDLNVLLDALLRRAPWHVDADRLLQAHAQGLISIFLSALTLANFVYIARKMLSKQRILSDVRTCLQDFEIMSLTKDHLVVALSASGPDFEDNLQDAAAEEASLDAIVTRDPAGFVGSSLPVLSPAEFIQRYLT